MAVSGVIAGFGVVNLTRFGVQVPAGRARLYVLCLLAAARRPEFGVGQLNVLRRVSARVRVALSSPPKSRR